MSAAATLTWPGSRVLAGWWPSLGRWQPRSVWLHLFLLHRVEALMSVSRGPPLDRLNRLLLEAIAGPPEGLTSRLGLEPSLVERLLAELENAGLARHEGVWRPTEAGREALAGRRDICTLQERRTFYFAEGYSSHPGARFIPLDNPPNTPWTDAANATFDLRVLTDCVARPAEWKQRHGFPAEVCAVAAPEGWQGVVIDRPEQLFALLVLGPDGHLLGFPVQAATWQLQAERPVLRIGEGWREALPELTVEPSLEEWRQAWRNWGQPRNLPMGELEACHLEHVGARLRVKAPRPLVDRLRSARSDAIKGEAWLLAGADRTRVAALIELVED